MERNKELCSDSPPISVPSIECRKTKVSFDKNVEENVVLDEMNVDKFLQFINEKTDDRISDLLIARL